MQQLTPTVHMMWCSVLHCAATNPYIKHCEGVAYSIVQHLNPAVHIMWGSMLYHVASNPYDNRNIFAENKILHISF